MKKALISISLSACLLLCLFGGCAVTKKEPIPMGIENVYIVPNSIKYLRDQSISSNGISKLSAKMAKNEGEGMQFVLNFPTDIKNAKLEITDLVNTSGSKLKAVELYRENYIYVGKDKQAVAYENKKGWYPDALIPLQYEDLNTCDITAGNNQGFWITVWSNLDQEAGIYKGTARVTFDGGERVIPVEVEVWDFAVPVEPSFETAYGSWIWDITKYYNKLDALKTMTPAELELMYSDYYLKYRITTTDSPYYSSLITGGEAIEKYLNDPRVSSCRIHVGFVNNNGKLELSEETKNDIDYLRSKGLLNKVFTYLFDEPDESDAKMREIKQLTDAVRAYAPEIRNMITTPPRENGYGIVDNWCGCWGAKTVTEEYTRDRQEAGDTVWWYGCIGPQAPYPTYHVPDALMTSRLVHWMQKDWNITGNLYWATGLFGKYSSELDAYLPEGRDVWVDPQAFPQAAGDGYLCYPGAENDGVINRNIPIPTMRLESIRDGSEDNEYLCILQNKIQACLDKYNITDVTADAVMDTYYTPLYNTMGDFNHNPDLMLKMREILAHDIMSSDKIIAAVLPYTSNKITSGREVRIYAPSGSTVVIAGENASEKVMGGYSLYSAIFDTFYEDLKQIEISINDNIYTRYLKRMEDCEYIELGKANIVKNVELLKIPEDKIAVREKYETASFEESSVKNLGGLDDQLNDAGTYSESEKVIINKDPAFAYKVKTYIAETLQNTIPVVPLYEDNFSNEQDYKNKFLTVYVPANASVKIDGQDANLIEKTEVYAKYGLNVVCEKSGRIPFNIEVTQNEKTENTVTIINQKIEKAVNLVDFSTPDLTQTILEYSRNNIDGLFSIIGEDGEKTLLLNLDKSKRYRLYLTSKCFTNTLTDFTGYTHLRFEIENTTNVKTKGVNVEFIAGSANLSAESQELEPNSKTTVIIKIPTELGSNISKVSRIAIAQNTNSGRFSAEEGSYIIKNITLYSSTD